ncbi:hypothetical protein ACFQV8_03800 [Pseudonocardia benzenivorans]
MTPARISGVSMLPPKLSGVSDVRTSRNGGATPTVPSIGSNGSSTENGSRPATGRWASNKATFRVRSTW